MLLDIDETFVDCDFEVVDISDATKAARTSGVNELHASMIDAGSKGLGMAEASSLQIKIQIK